jgi:hypothetical protein
MRIAIVHTGEPGGTTGRLTRALSRELAERGHHVALIGGAQEASRAGVEVLRAWRPPHVRGCDWYEPGLDAAPGALWHLLRGSYDLAHAFDLAHAWAAVRAGPLGAPPTVLSLHDPPDRRYLVGRRYRLEMLRASIAGCAAVTVPSEESATLLRRYLMADPVVVATEDLAPPVDVYEEIYAAAISPNDGR